MSASDTLQLIQLFSTPATGPTADTQGALECGGAACRGSGARNELSANTIDSG